MPGKFNPRQFFRVASNHALSTYFAQIPGFPALEWASMRETQVDPIIDGLAGLDEESRARVESDLTLIHGLADELGLQAVLDEARFHDVDLEPEWQDLDGFHEKLIATYLRERSWLVAAGRLRDADKLPAGRWLRRTGVAVEQMRDDKPARDELGTALAAYLRQAQGRGYHCEVEALRRGEAIYFFAYPEDYSRVEGEYIEGHLDRRPRRFATEMVFVLRPEANTLDTWFAAPKKVVSDIEDIFGRVILGRQLGELVDSKPVYQLNALKERDYTFAIEPGHGLDEIRVQSLRLAILGRRADRVTVEADTTEDPFAVYDLLDDTLGRQGSRIPLALVNITRVKLQARFSPDGRRGRNTKTFELTHPNGCSLEHQGRDAMIRACLAASGIETAPEPPNETA